MAPGWYSRRHWTIFRRELETLAASWRGGRLLNVGCGHGADFLPFRKGFDLYGLDLSPAMLRFARKYAAKFEYPVNLVLGDSVTLPFADGAFDRVISVATYHHIRERWQRLEAFKELRRVLRPGGEAFITVWNRWQPAFWYRPRDTYVIWRTKGRDLKRFYHLFSRGEVKGLVKRAGLTILAFSAEATYVFPVKTFSKNICLLVKRE